MNERRYRTGEVAAQSGVSIATLRYYERRGLISEPVRSPSGYRAYPAATINTVRLIKSAQALGFTLKEIGELLRIRDDPNGRCSEALTLASNKATEVEERIETLTDNLRALRGLLETCTAQCHSPAADCPVFEALAGAPTHARKRA
jgi:DNA-binding transcriptional MerR regulator